MRMNLSQCNNWRPGESPRVINVISSVRRALPVYSHSDISLRRSERRDWLIANVNLSPTLRRWLVEYGCRGDRRFVLFGLHAARVFAQLRRSSWPFYLKFSELLKQEEGFCVYGNMEEN